MHLRESLKSAAIAFRLLFGRATEPHFLFPSFAVVVLSVIWWTTLNLINVERISAEQASIALNRELVGTYEAQVVRALREIDQTLKFVKYAYEHHVGRDTLKVLKDRALLPPDIVYVISITNPQGNVVASTRPTDILNVADQEYFQKLIHGDTLAVSRPQRNPDKGEWKLQFSRRLNADDGTFVGVVLVSVDAAFFVSGYEPSKLGEHGMLGMLGTDGVFRIKRTGNDLSAGDVVDYASVVPGVDQPDAEATVLVNSWDGVRRYISTRRLFDFPLAIIVGLSEDEQLAQVNYNKRVYLWRATVGSALLLLIVAMLCRLSWKLAQARRCAIEDQAAYAKRIEHLAYHDSLTALPNRSMFSTFLHQSMNQARRHSKQLALLFLDLDHFKEINDTLGHEFGDKLLQEVAVRLKSCLRDSDTVFRLGGDEFVALLPELNEEKYEATVAQKILSAIAQPFILQGQEFRVTVSIGISTYPQDGQDEQTLTKNADIAMYQAKEKGKNNFQFYSQATNTDLPELPPPT